MSYSGALTREQFMFQEMRITARMKLEGLSDQEIAQSVFEDNLFQYPTERVIKSKCRACLKRIECIWDMPTIVEVLASGTYREAKQACFIAMMCQSQLLAEFMVRVIGEKYRNLDMTLTRKDMNLFFQYLMEQDEHAQAHERSQQQYLCVLQKRGRELDAVLCHVRSAAGSKRVYPGLRDGSQEQLCLDFF